MKLHAVCDGEGRPLAMCLTAGQVSDHVGTRILYPVLPEGGSATMIADKGYDSDEYRAALQAKGYCVLHTAAQGPKGTSRSLQNPIQTTP